MTTPRQGKRKPAQTTRRAVKALPGVSELTERQALKIIKAGDREVAQGKAKTLRSLLDLKGKIKIDSTGRSLRRMELNEATPRPRSPRSR